MAHSSGAPGGEAGGVLALFGLVVDGAAGGETHRAGGHAFGRQPGHLGDLRGSRG